MANIVSDAHSDTTISVLMTNITSSQDQSMRGCTAEWKIYFNGSLVSTGYATVPLTGTYGANYIFTNLMPQTQYDITCLVDIPGSPPEIFSGLTVVTDAAPPPVNPPPYYSWTYLKNSGEPFNLTAGEWNGLTGNINEVRQWNGYLSYQFTVAYTGNVFTADMYNQAVYAIRGMAGQGSGLSTVAAGSTIYASQLNALVSAINLVPR